MTYPASLDTVLSITKDALVVSVQAYDGEPLRDTPALVKMAQSCVAGGAVAIRAQGLDDIRAMKAALDVPIIGLWKDGNDPVFITPTLDHAIAVVDAGADVVALDATRRPRPDGRTFVETLAELRTLRPGVVVMADCGSLEDARAAAEAGADLLGTTLAGYTEDRPKSPGPDLELVADIARELVVPVIAEGRVYTPAQAAAALRAGAWSVVVGTGITHPATITGWFASAVEDAFR